MKNTNIIVNAIIVVIIVTTSLITAAPCSSYYYHSNCGISASGEGNSSCEQFNKQCVPSCTDPTLATPCNQRPSECVFEHMDNDGQTPKCSPKCSVMNLDSNACIGSDSCIWVAGKCLSVCSAIGASNKSQCEGQTTIGACQWISAVGESQNRYSCATRCTVAIDATTCTQLSKQQGGCAWNFLTKTCERLCSSFHSEASCNSFSDQQTGCKWYGSYCSTDCTKIANSTICLTGSVAKDCVWWTSTPSSSSSAGSCTTQCWILEYNKTVCAASPICAVVPDSFGGGCSLKQCSLISNKNVFGITRNKRKQICQESSQSSCIYVETTTSSGTQVSGSCELSCLSSFLLSGGQCTNNTSSSFSCIASSAPPSPTSMPCDIASCSTFSNDSAKCSSFSKCAYSSANSKCYEQCYRFSANKATCESRNSNNISSSSGGGCIWNATQDVDPVSAANGDAIGCFSNCSSVVASSSSASSVCRKLKGCIFRKNACKIDCTLYRGHAKDCKNQEGCEFLNSSRVLSGCFNRCSEIEAAEDCESASFCFWDRVSCSCRRNCDIAGAVGSTALQKLDCLGAGGACDWLGDSWKTCGLIKDYSPTPSTCLPKTPIIHTTTPTPNNNSNSSAAVLPPKSSFDAVGIGIGASVAVILIVVIVIYFAFYDKGSSESAQATFDAQQQKAASEQAQQNRGSNTQYQQFVPPKVDVGQELTNKDAGAV